MNAAEKLIATARKGETIDIDLQALLSSLESVPKEDDWEQGTTTWTLDDESKVQVEGEKISVFGIMPNTNEEGFYFVGWAD